MTSVAEGRRAETPAEWRSLWVAVGCLVLGAAMQSLIVLPPGWLSILLATAATVALSRDRKLGWIPAGMLVVVALPFGRGGDVNPLEVFGLPVRPQDPVIALALAGGAWEAIRHRGRMRAPMQRLGLAAFTLFLGMGLVALVVGVLRGHEPLDILRDARWWGLYLVAPMAILAGTRRAALLRGLMVGITLFAALVVVTAVLPRFDGALKDQVYLYDRGLLRLQFGNSMLLLPAIAYVLWRTLRRPGVWGLAWLALLVAAQLLSLTRVSIFTTILVGIVLVVMHVRRRRGAGRPGWRAVAATGLVLVVSMVGAVGLSELGTSAARENPLARILFQGSSSDISSTLDSISSGGRFDTYLNAVNAIGRFPVLGGGLGQLVGVRFAFDESRTRTEGTQPGVDNAYLTVGLKAGVIGMAVFVGLMLLTLRAGVDRRLRVLRGWYAPALLGVGVLTLTQGFAVSSYGPFVLALLLVVPFLGYASTSRSAASGQA